MRYISFLFLPPALDDDHFTRSPDLAKCISRVMVNPTSCTRTLMYLSIIVGSEHVSQRSDFVGGHKLL